MDMLARFMHRLPFASGDGEAAQSIFWLVVTVIVVISQVLKANKKSGARPSAAPVEQGRENEPGEELHRFLESLGGGARPTPAAPPKLPQTAPLNTARRTAFETGRKQTASSAAYAKKAKPAAYAKARPGAEPLRKRVPPLPARPLPPAPEILDAWTKPRKTAFQHFKHSDDLGIKADTQMESLQQLRKGIGDDLVGKAHLRKAMVLKEILGPPLALRNPAAAS